MKKIHVYDILVQKNYGSISIETALRKNLVNGCMIHKWMDNESMDA